MSQPEAKLSRKIMAAWRARGVWCFKVHGSQYQPAGLPDILGCYRGISVGFETKMPGNKPTEIQHHVHRQMRAAGARVAWGCTVDDALALLDQVDEMLDA